MTQNTFYCAATTPAGICVRQQLQQAGLTPVDHPAWDTAHLILDVPSFPRGNIPHTLLESLNPDTLIWGGNLNQPCLAGRKTVDLLQDEDYLLENAAITARCAGNIALTLIAAPPRDTPTLVIGLGRIGKPLACLLKEMGFPVTAAVRTDKDAGFCRDAGIRRILSAEIRDTLPGYRLIINTAPEPVILPEDGRLCQNAVKLDLASRPGILCTDAISARGLPGRYAPEESGKLIARTILRRLKEERL